MERKVYDRAAISLSHSDLDGHGYALYPGRELDWATGRLGLPPRSFDYGFILVPRYLNRAEPDWDQVDHVMHCEASVESARSQLSFPGEMQLAWYVDITGNPKEEFKWVDAYIDQLPKC
jgi:hypothetical protein